MPAKPLKKSYEEEPMCLMGRSAVMLWLVLAQGCAAGSQPGLTGVYQTWDDVITRWIGAHKNDLYYELGPPTFHPETLKDGEEEMVWDLTIASMPGQAEQYNTLPLYTSQDCKLVFIADTKGIIRNGRRLGCD
jgi:hypothetical protein